jgi:hypothetical protein
MYTLYKEIIIEPTKAEKKQGKEDTFTVEMYKQVETREEADAWVNVQADKRSWSFSES